MAGNLSYFLKSNCMLPLSQFSYRRGLGTSDALLTVVSQYTTALDRGMQGRLVQLDLSAAFDRVSHCCLLYNLRSLL